MTASTIFLYQHTPKSIRNLGGTQQWVLKIVRYLAYIYMILRILHNADKYQSNISVLTAIYSYLHSCTCLKGFLTALAPRSEQMKDILAKKIRDRLKCSEANVNKAEVSKLRIPRCKLNMRVNS